MPRPSKVMAPLAVLVVALSVWAGWDWFRRPNARVEKGNLWMRKGKPDKALAAYDKASRKLGRRPELDYNRALALFAQKKYAEAAREFLSAVSVTSKSLRARALYNLGNAYSKMAETQAAKGTPALEKASRALEQAKKAGLDKPGKGSKEVCAALKTATEAYKAASEAHKLAGAEYRKARTEYRAVLLRMPSHFRTKWNMELALRGLTRVKAVQAEAERVAKLYAAKCEQKKKKDQKKQDKQNQDKQKQDKQKQDRQKQDDQKQDKQKQQQKQQPKPQSPQDMERKRAEQDLDRLERRQRQQRRDTGQVPVGRKPIKDW